MLTIMLLEEPAFAPIAHKLKAVYTYGAPMIGGPEFAMACNHSDFIRDKVSRYVYANDIVPQLPAKESGPFAHFGQEYQYKPDGGGRWQHNQRPRQQLRSFMAIVTNPLAFLARQFKLTRNILSPSVDDNRPEKYIDALRPSGVRTEFGD